jgi:hypothetical protein
MNTGAWGVMIDSGCEYDPNYHRLEDNPYKELVSKIIKGEKINRFVDIHGLNKDQDIDIAFYYQTKYTNSIKLAKELCNSVDRKDLKGLICNIYRFGNDNQETLSEFVSSKLRVPAVQVEIARYIRDSTTLRNLLINYLSEYIRG